MEANPEISIVMPCRDERRFVVRCLESIVSNDLGPHSAELLVVDGMSSDGTRSILDAFAARHTWIRVLDNPHRLTPHALNIALREARGRVIVRVDAHAVYAADYFRTLAEGLERYGAQNVGGIRRTAIIRDTPLACAICLSISEPFTAGNAHYRTSGDRVREVETVFGGCYPREVFERLGGFNEKMIRAQDREFNARLLRAGGRIVLDPATWCEYFPRTDLKSYARWMFRSAYALFAYHRHTDVFMLRTRNLVPLALVATATAAVSAAVLAPRFLWMPSGLLAVYLLASVVRAARVALRERSAPLWPAAVLVYWATHFAYGLGSLAGLPGFLWGMARRARPAISHPVQVSPW